MPDPLLKRAPFDRVLGEVGICGSIISTSYPPLFSVHTIDIQIQITGVNNNARGIKFCVTRGWMQSFVTGTPVFAKPVTILGGEFRTQIGTQNGILMQIAIDGLCGKRWDTDIIEERCRYHEISHALGVEQAQRAPKTDFLNNVILMKILFYAHTMILNTANFFFFYCYQHNQRNPP